PLALDLNGDGVQTVAFGETEGTFDLNGDGTAIESGWLSSEDAFLAVDNNGNGKIDNISELFGGEVGEGFAKLATYDTNNDGVIDSEEILGGGLTLWQDANSNHSTDAGELISLASQGIASLDTAFVETPVYQNGNVLIEHGSATKTDGSKIDLVDAYFQVDTIFTAQLSQDVSF
ncbi:MAG: bacteriocin, partial [Cyanobacteria bacterium J06576_12]